MLAAGLSATEKTDAHEEDELQAAEEVCAAWWPSEVPVWVIGGRWAPIHSSLSSRLPLLTVPFSELL